MVTFAWAAVRVLCGLAGCEFCILRGRAFDRNGVLVSAVVFIFIAGLASFVLPAVDEVPSGFPVSVLWCFRLASIGARAILWGVLGLAFAEMAQSWMKRGHRV
jgi:hypothetical protein